MAPPNSEPSSKHPNAPPDGDSELAIAFDDPEVWEDDDLSGGVSDSTYTAPNYDDLQKELTALKESQAATEKRLNDTRAHSDRLFNENRIATQMLAELSGQREQSESARQSVQFHAPEVPSADSLIGDPSLAVKYAQEYGNRVADYTRKSVLMELRPFLGATAQTSPLVTQLTNRARVAAVLEAKSTIDPSEHTAFDEAVPRIADMMSKNANGQALSIDPRSWIASYRALGGSARPVKPASRSATPMSAGHNNQGAGDRSTPSPGRVPQWAATLARRAGVDPNEYWKRHQTRLGQTG